MTRSKLWLLPALGLVAACAFSYAVMLGDTANVSAQGTTVPRVTVTVRDGVAVAPAILPTGFVAITFSNAGGASYDGVLVRLGAGVTPQQFVDFANANPDDLDGVLRLGTLLGGPVGLPPGATADVVYDLGEGTYIIVGFASDDSILINATMQAAPPPSATTAPDVAGEIVMGDFYFTAPPIRAGTATYKISNVGEQAHHMIVFRFAEGFSFEQFLEYEGDAEAAGLVSFPNGYDVVSPGRSAWPTLTFTPGTYTMVCFLPDSASSAPHFVLGMVQDFIVE